MYTSVVKGSTFCNNTEQETPSRKQHNDDQGALQAGWWQNSGEIQISIASHGQMHRPTFSWTWKQGLLWNSTQYPDGQAALGSNFSQTSWLFKNPKWLWLAKEPYGLEVSTEKRFVQNPMNRVVHVAATRQLKVLIAELVKECLLIIVIELLFQESLWMPLSPLTY